ncbi:DNA-binding transcriptional LysR family regulator [Neorhizobium galegae]|uniref:LysR family transcriptional regulator n=1 Tax=Neorhizobium galegae TaxID=399 RepID=UPI001AE5B6CF|nr:LysR family transcriptional regulator [Neorhizobium galegae]MBP2561881.1 DNA-binding transcriptional LysR family regulator [Neorhizobium galegae]MDQ0134884.1 DNA-binding transcriptional LysR family regulator [Neorhizobium galegae]
MFNITLRRMEVLVAVVEEGSFAAAADRFGIAQPSVSAHIMAIEKEIGGQIFVRRRGRKPLLTEIGRSVLQHAREFLAEADDMRADVVKIRGETGQQVVLSCQRSLANFVLRKDLTDFAIARPDIQLVLRIGKQEDVFSEVRDGVADVGCFLGNEDLRGVRAETIGREKLVLIASPNHPLAHRKRVKPQDVARYDFVGPPPSSLFGRGVSKLLANAGISHVKVAAQATEYQFLREFVVAGVGIACSLERSVAADLERGDLVKVDFAGDELGFDVRQIASTRRALPKPASDLMEFLRSRHQMPG